MIDQRERDRRYIAQHFAKRRNAGLCIHCGDERDDVTLAWRCRECQRRQNETQQARRRLRRMVETYHPYIGLVGQFNREMK